MSANAYVARTKRSTASPTADCCVNRPRRSGMRELLPQERSKIDPDTDI
jgi:hypothetical protein